MDYQPCPYTRVLIPILDVQSIGPGTAGIRAGTAEQSDGTILGTPTSAGSHDVARFCGAAHPSWDRRRP
jgi:hypothetical protein